MNRRGRLYQRGIVAISAVYVALGIVILALTVSRGGGPLSIGALLGLAFVAVGAGRIFVSRRTGGDGG